jgi:hypothetical protein
MSNSFNYSYRLDHCQSTPVLSVFIAARISLTGNLSFTNESRVVCKIVVIIIADSYNFG